MVFPHRYLFYIFLYILFFSIFNQSYKVATQKMQDSGALTVLIQSIGSIFCLLFVPFFPIKFPTNRMVYFFLFLAIIFYALHDRLSTISRSGVEASIYSILKQLPNAFMVILGLFIFKEKFIWNRILGAFLIISSNTFVFCQKGKRRLDKYLILGILANLCLTVALVIDVNFSKQFNLSFYVFLTLIIPALFICLVERITTKGLIYEYQQGNQKAIILTSFSWSLMMITKLLAYQLGQMTIVAPLCSLSVAVNIILGYFLLKEKDHLLRKLIAAIFIIIGIIFIKI